MHLSRRGFFAAGAVSALVAPAFAAEEAPKPALRPGQLSEESLGTLLKAMNLKPEKVEQRYDFTFRAVLNKEEWDLSMTAVLSSDSQSVWIMAWLDELPKSADAVPRTALLRLLAANDRLGNGKFFAYVASNRRFVLQRVIPNENISTRGFATALQDLGASVMESHPFWSVAGWSGPQTPATTATAAKPAAEDDDDDEPADKGMPASQQGLQGAGRSPAKTASGQAPVRQ